MHKIFNRYSVKVSYSYTENFSEIISSHNKDILQSRKNQELLCNCKQKENCPMQGKCWSEKCSSTPIKLQRIYIGISENESKKRYCACTQSFRNKHYKNETSFSSYVWKIKNTTGQTPTLTWWIVRTVPAYSNATKKCALYLHMKLKILVYLDPELLLNIRSEIISRCLYQRKYFN